MIQQFTFDGNGRQIDAKGVFFRYESATDGAGMTDLMLTIDGQNIGVFSPGDSLELPTSARRWEVRPVSSGCTGTVKIGNALIKSQKLQGIVQTVDGAKARSASGSAFSAYLYQASSTGNYARVQLWNSSSDKNLIVNTVGLLISGSGGFAMHSLNSPLATVGGNGKPKRLGLGVVSAGQIRRDITTTAQPEANAMRLWNIGANQTYECRPTEPFIIGPGYGLTMWGTYLATDCGASFEWFEEAM